MNRFLIFLMVFLPLSCTPQTQGRIRQKATDNECPSLFTHPIGLVPIYPKESLLNIKTTPQLGVKYITISDEVTIKLDEKTHNTIYYSPDLVGITIR